MNRLSGFFRDLRLALRLGVRRPRISAIAVLTIALGIATTTAVFSIVNGVLLQPLPYPEEERLLVLGERHDELFSGDWFVSPANFRDWRERNRVFEEMGMRNAFDSERADFTGMTVQEPLFIGMVLHKAFVAVDETGTTSSKMVA